MSVISVECNKCAHYDVCSIKNDVMGLSGAITQTCNIKDVSAVDVKLTCRYYSGKPVDVKGKDHE